MVESPLMDRLLELKCDLHRATKDVRQMKETINLVEKKFEESEFNVYGVDGPDDDTVK